MHIKVFSTEVTGLKKFNPIKTPPGTYCGMDKIGSAQTEKRPCKA